MHELPTREETYIDALDGEALGIAPSGDRVVDPPVVARAPGEGLVGTGGDAWIIVLRGRSSDRAEGSETSCVHERMTERLQPWASNGH